MKKALLFSLLVLWAGEAQAQFNFGRLNSRLPATVLADGVADSTTFLRGDLKWSPITGLALPVGTMVLSPQSCPAGFNEEGSTIFILLPPPGATDPKPVLVKLFICKKS